MNQKKYFLIAVCLVTTIACTYAPLCAQNNFGSQQFAPAPPQQTFIPPDAQRLQPVSPYGNWVPPVSSSPVRQASHTEPVNMFPGFSDEKLKPLTFPESPAPFPTGTTTDSTDQSLESSLNSAAEMFSNFKDSTSEKFSGFFGSFKENGLMSNLGSMFGSSDISRMLGSLALVLGLYFSFVWVMRKINPGGNRGLPSEVIEVLGQLPFGPRRDLQLVRLGSKLLLLMNSPEGTQPIGEITDPEEVEYLASLCPGKKKTNITAVAAIEQAAKRLTGSRSNDSDTTSNVVSSNRRIQQTSSAGTGNGASVNDVLRALERAAKGGTVFEA